MSLREVALGRVYSENFSLENKRTKKM